uniref:Uncharacterized protein n=2 Tax=Aegilops tauschii subsp. strangulata TaxID=200361 RepID=A0A453JH15_AEGTS
HIFHLTLGPRVQCPTEQISPRQVARLASHLRRHGRRRRRPMPHAPGVAPDGPREDPFLLPRLLQRHPAPSPRGRLPELSPPSPADATPVLLPAIGRLRRAGARRASRSGRVRTPQNPAFLLIGSWILTLLGSPKSVTCSASVSQISTVCYILIQFL